MGEKFDDDVHQKINELSKTLLKQQEIIDDYIHEKPYTTMGVGLLAGLGLGVLISSFMRRRRD
jgi:ElaB/YqjD/DUF883 family membrane-anchored ribosome-binding protein